MAEYYTVNAKLNCSHKPDEYSSTLYYVNLYYPQLSLIGDPQARIQKIWNQSLAEGGGPDELPARLLKECAVELAPIYQQLFTTSYNTGTLPSSWRHAMVCPIFKKGRKDLPENYRPVSLTSIPCKLFEHIIVSKTWEHLNKFNIISNLQHGFRSGLSCETQLVDALYDWTEVLNRGSGQVDCIVLDLSKAFEVVPHERQK